MSKVAELQAELERANTRIAELEKYVRDRPITIRQMKTEIAQMIGIELSSPFSYGMSTVNRDDLLKIYNWIKERTK